MADRTYHDTGSVNAGIRYAAASPALNDNADLAYPCRAVYVGTIGDLKVTMIDGGTVTLQNLAPGIWHPMAVRRIFATGTDIPVGDIVLGY